MDVLLNMANSLSNDDSLKSYLLQFINKLKIKLGKSLSVPIDTRDICNDYPYPNAILSPIPLSRCPARAMGDG